MKKRMITMNSVGFRCAPSTIDSEGRLTNLRQIVQHYIRNYRSDAKEELDWFRTAESLPKAIQNAGMAINDKGKRLPHQWRLRKISLQKATKELLSVIRRIHTTTRFEDLIGIIESTAGSLYGIGELYVYDTALRIGAYLDIYPEEIYLHAGTRKGARALGLNTRRHSIPIEDLPRVLRQLPAREIEDILCIYKHRFS